MDCVYYRESVIQLQRALGSVGAFPAGLVWVGMHACLSIQRKKLNMNKKNRHDIPTTYIAVVFHRMGTKA